MVYDGLGRRMVFAGEGREYRGNNNKRPKWDAKEMEKIAWIDVLSRSGLWRHPIEVCGVKNSRRKK